MIARAAIRLRLRASTGASVATAITQEPPVYGRASPRDRAGGTPAATRNSSPIGTPAIVSEPPKFVCTSTPTVYFASLRDDVPMPPLNPNAIVPVPAPTDPSSTGPPAADLIA